MTAPADSARILIVEDNPSLVETYRAYLETLGVHVDAVNTGSDAFAHLEKQLPDLMLLDLRLPDMEGFKILEHINAKGLPVATIMITAHGSVDSAVQAIRLGAVDFLTKPFDADRLRVTVANALDKQRLSHLVDTYRETYERERFHGFLGASLAMQRVYKTIESAAPSKASIFITGESGTGKEVCAQAIHRSSPRAEKPFTALNCAAIPRDLMESEIFGHVKGAFTGAVNERRGAASLADGGTLFLDEICEMDLDLQTKLLRFTQTGCFQKVGGSKTECVDVRFVCATNRDPVAEVAAGRFREDLFYRLHVISIHLPPLREREEDVLLIARHLLDAFSREENKTFEGLTSDAEASLLRHAWPGNVRELQNVIRQAVVLNAGGRVGARELPIGNGSQAPNREPASTPAAPPAATVHASGDDQAIKPLWEVEKETIERAIRLSAGDVSRAAVALEISASTIYRKLRAWKSLDKAAS